jgi:hypothetical protein
MGIFMNSLLFIQPAQVYSIVIIFAVMFAVMFTLMVYAFSVFVDKEMANAGK